MCLKLGSHGSVFALPIDELRLATNRRRIFIFNSQLLMYILNKNDWKVLTKLSYQLKNFRFHYISVISSEKINNKWFFPIKKSHWMTVFMAKCTKSIIKILFFKNKTLLCIIAPSILWMENGPILWSDWIIGILSLSHRCIYNSQFNTPVQQAFSLSVTRFHFLLL